MALAVALRADPEEETAVRLEPQIGRFGAGEGAGLDIGCHADAADLAARLALFQPLVELRPGGRSHRGLHMPFRLADIVFAAREGGVGKRLDEVPAAYLVLRKVHFAGADIDQLLDQECRFRPPRPAIGVDRGRVGIDARDRRMKRADLVEAWCHDRAERRHQHPVARGVGAHIGDDVRLERQEAAVAVHRHRCGNEVVASLRIGEKLVRAIRHPLYRHAEPLGRFADEDIFAIGPALRAESAADIVGQDMDVALLHAEAFGDTVTAIVHALGAGRQDIAAVDEFPDRAAHLHVVGNEAVVPEADRRHMVGAVEGGRRLLRIAYLLPVGDVTGETRCGARPLIRRGDFQIDHRITPLEAERDQFQRILRLIAALGDDEGERIAHVADLAAHQNRDGATLGPCSVGLLRTKTRRQRLQMADIVCGEDEPDARRTPGSGQVAQGKTAPTPPAPARPPHEAGPRAARHPCSDRGR